MNGIPRLYGLSDMPVWENDNQLRDHIQAGIEYRKDLLTAMSSYEVDQIQINIKHDLESFENFSKSKAQMFKIDTPEKDDELQKRGKNNDDR